MPNCNQFFNELANCLTTSECVKIHHKKPSECLELLLKEKAMSKYEMEDISKYSNIGFKRTVKNENTKAPVECALAHQSYVECKVSLVIDQVDVDESPVEISWSIWCAYEC
jgi:hypothetical protein